MRPTSATFAATALLAFVGASCGDPRSGSPQVVDIEFPIGGNTRFEKTKIVGETVAEGLRVELDRIEMTHAGRILLVEYPRLGAGVLRVRTQEQPLGPPFHIELPGERVVELDAAGTTVFGYRSALPPPGSHRWDNDAATWKPTR